jgi:DNA-binding GntR family transcriptional regulator
MPPLDLTPRTVSHPHRAKYLQIADAFRAAIGDGYLAGGENLPSEEHVAKLVGVSKGTARAGFDVLERDGLIERRNGVPARVVERGQVRIINGERYRDTDRRIEMGIDSDASAFTRGHHITWEQFTIDLEIRLEDATPKDRELLQLDATAPKVWRRHFLKYADGVPVEIQRSAVPTWVAERCPWMVDPAAHPYPDGTQRELANGGLRAKRVDERHSVRMPSEEEKGDLRITQVPVLDTERVFWVVLDGVETPVESSRLVLPASRHQLFYTTRL